MSWKEQCLTFVKKYGKAAKVVATGVLNVVAPGSGTLVSWVEMACDKACGVAQDHWEQSLLEATQANAAELQRLGQVFELLSGDLASLCDKAAAFADQLDDLPDILARAIAANPDLSRALHAIEEIKRNSDAFKDDLRRLIAHNEEEALPLYARMHRVCDYFDELWALGIRPRDFAQQVHRRGEAAARITQGDTTGVDVLLLELRTAAPKAASLCVLEAAAAMREHNYPAAQRALTSAVKLQPRDVELVELSRRATVLATQVTPRTPAVPEAEEPPRLQPGETLDGWLLEARLGAGGWGQVFRATRAGQTRALKVMHPQYAADPGFVARFKTEIASLLRVPRHPNLVGIEAGSAFGYCAERRTWYLTMEYIDGPTLEGYLARKGPLSEGQVRKVFPDAIAGLAEAHRAGIVHRDIKPSNLIFRKQDSRLVFVDFGLAVGVEELGQTKVGGLSALFAAPEQHYGEPATQASDVFSLCAVIHYALQYDKPELRKPNRFAPSLIPESLRAAMTQGMKPNAEERLPDAGQLLAAFRSSPDKTELKRAARISADRVFDYALWKQQIEQRKQQLDLRKAEAARAAAAFDYTQAVAILETVPIKERDEVQLADWTHRRDRLAELWARVESRWREMNEDELIGDLEEIVRLYPDHPRAKPWLAQFGTSVERQRKKLCPDRIGARITNSQGMQFAWVPPGESWLGGESDKPGTTSFTLERGLWCGVYPVTQAEWRALMCGNPSHFKGNPRFPVENVSWSAVQKFIEKLNLRSSADGLCYRLPTDEEWEYICRGGPLTLDQSKYDFYFAQSRTDLTPCPSNDLFSTQANFNGQSPAGSAGEGPFLQRPCDVGSYLPNPLGIHDLHGNVWEWTSSQRGSDAVIRGGGWSGCGDNCKASLRRTVGLGHASNRLGFRVLAVPIGKQVAK